MSCKLVTKKRNFDDFVKRNSKAVVSASSVELKVAITQAKGPDPNKKKSPSSFLLVSMNENPTTVNYQAKIQKDENGNKIGSTQQVDEAGLDHTQIVPGQNNYMASFDAGNMADKLDLPLLAHVSVTAGVYEGRPNFKCSNIRPITPLDNIDSFRKFVHGTELGMVPNVTRFGENESSKSFILPISGDNEFFKSTEISVDYTTRERLMWVDPKEPSNMDIGFNVLDDFKPVNRFSLEFIDDKEVNAMELSYTQNLFKVFGITNRESWQCTGPVMFMCAKDAILSGYASKKRMDTLSCNKMDEPEIDQETGLPRYFTKAFATKLTVDMVKTVKAAGFPITAEWAVQCLKGKKVKGDISQHPLNADWDDKIKTANPGEPLVLNLSEFPNAFRQEFNEYVAENGVVIQYFGIFDYKESALDDLQSTDENTPTTIQERQIKPVVIYAIIGF